MIYVEQNCAIEHQGRKFESGGAFYDGQRAVGYVGKRKDSDKHWSGAYHLTNWHGCSIGHCYLAKRWRVRSYVGSYMYQIYAWIEGVKYTGRGFGESMSVNLKRCAKQ
jgi:hypothetical protein